ncbi:MAG: YgjP-like metallopeptidase domain-containing protein [Cellvibrionaceae bacterium]
MAVHKYLAHYSPQLQQQVAELVDDNRLAEFLLNRYPAVHGVSNDQQLRDYVFALKNQFMKKSLPLSKVVYDKKIHVVNNALGLHSYVPRVQGNKLKSKNEIRISTVFKKAPEAFLKMIAVHELAHLKEKTHDKAFYRLCIHMLPDYHQLEFDMRVYLVQLELGGDIY